MVVGKLLILTASNTAFATDIENTQFFNYKSAKFTNRIAEFTFGWFKTLDDDQKQAYNQALTHAILYSDNGEVVRWYKNDASGTVVPSVTWPSGAGYCRRMHIQIIAFNVEKTSTATACLDETADRWTWYNK
jgi:surface antigen